MAKAAAPRKPRPLTPEELGRWGEGRFASLCEEARLVPHRPDHDLNGWDFFVEFPHPATEAGTDVAARQPPLQCFVQVKTVWEGRPEVDLGLSAAARLGKSPLPSFLCILEASEEPVLRRMHILHMSGPLLERVLRKLREMQAGGRSTLINKATFRVPVPKAQRALRADKAELLRALKGAVGPDHAAYRQAKDTFLRTAGFPTSPVTGTVRVRIDSHADYSDFLLGQKPLPVVAFEAAETRWGISIPFQLDAVPATLRAVPKPLDVEVVWRRAGSFEAVRLKMRALLARGSDEEGGVDRWLITHPNVEMRIDGTSFVMTTSGPSAVPMSYQALVQLHALEKLLATGGLVDVQLLFRGQIMMAFHPDGPVELRPSEAITALGKVLRQLGIVLAAAGLPDIQLPSGTWREWREHLRTLCALLEAPGNVSASVALEVPEDGTLEAEENEALYVTALEFEDCLLACYATCRGRLVPGEQPRRWRLHVSDFVVRDLRRVEKSDAAMRAFAKEAEAVTGLTSIVLIWGAFAGQSDQPLADATGNEAG